MKLANKTSFKFYSDQVSAKVYRYLNGEIDSDFTFREYAIERIDESKDLGISFFIHEEEVLRFSKKEEQSEILLFIGDTVDEDNNPTDRFREHINAIFAAFEEAGKLPRIRIFKEYESQIMFIHNHQTGESQPLNKSYNSGCKITAPTDCSDVVIDFFGGPDQ